MSTVTLDFADRVVSVRLRPSGEVFDGPFLEDLLAACGAVAERDDVSVALLSAEESVFASEWAADLLNSSAADQPLRACSALAELPVPVVAAVGGQISGAGLELALACDLRLAAADARFAVTELTCGRLPAAGSIQRLARLVGRSWAAWLLLTGEAIDAGTAMSIGLVNAVQPADRLASEAEALARAIASRGPLAVRYAKEALRQGLEMPLAQALQHELNLATLLQTSRDRTEGVSAFLEKRSPEFRGE
ncbi:MAG TPA: enoyl-CoA hydratase-related protein [Dehalococcoidia bacterium]|nr:enoyl-CoA hydratase-related protein [Dehalococcoidia bacterium]